MPKSKRYTAKEIISIIESHGFSLARQKGSHMQFVNKEGIRITVPFHGGDKILHPKIVATIKHDSGIDL